MRHSLLAFALAGAATPALAQDDGRKVYASVEGGSVWYPDLKLDIGGTEDAGHAETELGWGINGALGYDLGGFRVEAEVGYRRAGIDSYRSTLPTPVVNDQGHVIGDRPPGTYDYAGGTQSALSFMLNGMLDFGDDDGIQGFVGGGVGVARIKSELALNTDGDFLDDADTVFAWQVMAGLRAPLNDTIDVTLKYRFQAGGTGDFRDVVDREYRVPFRSHSVLGGLTFNFGRSD